MKEVVFIEKQKDSWQKLEAILDKKGSPENDELTNLYIKLTDDLAYCKTFYPNAKVTQYLNNLSARVYQFIYRNKKEFSGRFKTFWKEELPLVIAKHHRALLISFIVFLSAFGIGWLSASGDSTFVRLIPGDSYIYETEKNIESGKAMSINGNMREDAMFWYITANNIFVSFLCFMLGIFTPIGVFYILLRSGIIVGAFLYFFYERGLLGEAMTAIWMHGTIEISVIIVAGAAGIVLGSSFIFPGTLPRNLAFIQGAKDGMKIVVGLVPCFIIAGFIESFLTRHYDVNLFFSLSVTFISLVFIIGYFVVYPIILNKKHKDSESLKNEFQFKYYQSA